MMLRAILVSLATGLTFAHAPGALAGICLGSASCWNIACNNDIECTSTGICNACSSGAMLRHEAEAVLSPRLEVDTRDFPHWIESHPTGSSQPMAKPTRRLQPS